MNTLKDQQLPTETRPAARSSLGMTILRYGLALTVLVGPPIYLAKNPQAFTPLLDTLFSVFLFFLAFWVGRDKEFAEARRQANDRWMPHAEAVTYRLMTLFANVRGFSQTMRSSCGRAACDLPELKDDGLRAVRIKMKMECDASAQRLDDIGNQLEDAIGDWQRFIAANCREGECARIFDALQERWARLNQQEAVLAASKDTKPHEVVAP